MTAGQGPAGGAGAVSRGVWGRVSGAWRSGPLAVRSFRFLTGGQLASTVGAAAALLVFGVCNGLGNAILFTAGQRWTPPYVLGRVMGLMMMCMFGSYPLSVALAGVVVHHTGAALFFPIAGAVTGLAFLAGLSQQEYRAFGTKKPDGTYLLAGLKGMNGTATAPAATATSEGSQEAPTPAGR